MRQFTETFSLMIFIKQTMELFSDFSNSTERHVRTHEWIRHLSLYSLLRQRLPTSLWLPWTGPPVSPQNQTRQWSTNTSEKWWM